MRYVSIKGGSFIEAPDVSSVTVMVASNQCFLAKAVGSWATATMYVVDVSTVVYRRRVTFICL